MGSIPREADVTVSAYPGDPAPDTGEFCECDDNDDPVNWRPTGKFQAPLSGDISGSKLNTDTSGSKTVTTNISYEYECSVTGQTKWEDEVGNPWNKTFIVEDYWIEGNQSVAKNEPASYEVKTNTGNSPNVTNWDASGGTISGSGVNVEVTWSNPGNAKQVTATVDQYGDVFTYTDVIGDLVVEIELPDSNPYVVAKDEPVTFVAKEPEDGVAPYTYEWDFGGGNAPTGAKFQKTASNVKFGANTEGKENVITLTVRDSTGNSGQDTITVYSPVIVKKYPTRELWYLADGDDSIYRDKKQCVLEVNGGGECTFSWNIKSGSVILDDQSNFSVLVRPTAGSQDSLDITIELLHDGRVISFIDLEAYTPEIYEFIRYEDEAVAAPPRYGFITKAYFRVRDNFGRPIEAMTINEKFHPETRDDHIFNNWPLPDEVSGLLDNYGITWDNYEMLSWFGIDGLIIGTHPLPVEPENEIADQSVVSILQSYRVGDQNAGKGVLCEVHTLTYKRGKGRQ